MILELNKTDINALQRYKSEFNHYFYQTEDSNGDVNVEIIKNKFRISLPNNNSYPEMCCWVPQDSIKSYIIFKNTNLEKIIINHSMNK